MAQQNRELVLEAFRRRGGQQPSSAGIPGGAEATKQPGSPMQQVPQGQQPPQTASQEGIKQMKQSRPGESELIIKALSDRLKKI